MRKRNLTPLTFFTALYRSRIMPFHEPVFWGVRSRLSRRSADFHGLSFWIKVLGLIRVEKIESEGNFEKDIGLEGTERDGVL